MLKYIFYSASNSFSDAADYNCEIEPFAAPEGGEWRDGVPGDLKVFTPFQEAIDLFDKFKNLPITEQIKYGNHIALANVYASTNNWEQVKEILKPLEAEINA